MQSFREFVDQIQTTPEEDLQELYGRPTIPPHMPPIDLAKKREMHNKMDFLWNKFLKDAANLGYVVPRGESLKSMTLHNIRVAPHDVQGHYILHFPDSMVNA